MSANAIYDEDKKAIREQFFILSSSNMDKYQADKLYGYTYTGKYFNLNCLNNLSYIPKEAFGYYINIINGADEIIVKQDYYGLYGIFLYNNNGEFAISNSLLYLINYLSHKGIKLTINYPFLKSILWTWTSLFFEKTIVNEIEHVAHFYTLKIDKHKRTVEKVRNYSNIFQIDIDSRKGIDIIDDWHNRWFNLINTFTKERDNFGINITGGRDSRAALSTLCFNSKIDIDTSNVRFNCLEWYDKEDLEISSEIGAKLGFQINNYPKPARSYISTFLSLAYSFLTKMTIHNRITFNYFYFLDSYFYMGGDGGEFLRDHWLISPGSFISQFLNPKFPQYRGDIVNMLIESMENIASKYTTPLGPVHSVYECCRGRFHFGTCNLESVYTNYIALPPLLDPVLSQLKLNSNNQRNFDIIFAVIYDRYLTSLSNISFDRGHKISESTYSLARKINKKFPIDKEFHTRSISTSIAISGTPKLLDYPPNPLGALSEIFYSENFEAIITNLLDRDIFKFCEKQFSNGLFQLKEILWLNDHVASLLSIYLTVVAMQPNLAKRINNPLINELVQLGTHEDNL